MNLIFTEDDLSTGQWLFVEVGYYLAFKHPLKYAGHDFTLVPYYPSTPADLQSFTETEVKQKRATMSTLPTSSAWRPCSVGFPFEVNIID